MRLVVVLLFIWFFEAAFANKTKPVCKTTQKIACKNGIVLPAWVSPTTTDSKAAVAGRAFVYLIAMFYFFLGISIISDRFMAAIEIITSQEKEVTVRDPVNGKKQIVTVKIWNETVANLTLMALGSSAPEILLSVIEVIGLGFQAGELGPSTIVGSAAFNLFMITAVCVVVLPAGEVRRIRHIKVFAFTATCSMFAYIWLYLILSVFSPGVIEIWEGIITFLCFPAMVCAAWAIDKKINFYHLLRKRFRKTKKHGHTVIQTGDGDVVSVSFKSKKHHNSSDNFDEKDIELLTYEESDDPIEIMNNKKKIAMEAFHRARAKHPDADAIALKKLVDQENLKLQHKSRAFYRVQATRALTGQGNVLRIKERENDREVNKDINDETEEINANKSTVVGNYVQFSPDQYTVVESCGQCYLTVMRFGEDLKNTVNVDYETFDGTANEGDDYKLAKGTLEFKPWETIKKIPITIIDDELFELDEHFFCKLTAIRCTTEKAQNEISTTIIGDASTATVTILDDDYPGIFSLDHSKFEVMETVGVLTLRILRLIGARGKVSVPYRTIEGTASGGGVDYQDCMGEVEFFDDETIKTIDIPIIDREEYEKLKKFSVVLGEPKIVGEVNSTISNLSSVKDDDLRRVLEVGKPTLGEHRTCEVTIVENKEFKKTIDHMLAGKNKNLLGSNSWTQQFKEAFQVEFGGDEEEDVDIEPTYADYIMHYLSFFWKVLFAFVPPTDIWGGWACFTASIVMIGILTAITGDIASHFGCTVGLADSVVAISFVALGTSLPDTFASKVATINDEYADGSIGNVTGSNSVNVFLGIGLAWSVAAIYHSINGDKFYVDPGSLGFSVMLFCLEASVCIGILMYRRWTKSIRAELGGPLTSRYITSIFLFVLWLIYLLVSGLESYCYFTFKI